MRRVQVQATTIDDTGANQAEGGGTRSREATTKSAARQEAMVIKMDHARRKTHIKVLTKAIGIHPKHASKGNVGVDPMLNGSGPANDCKQEYPTEGGDASIIPTQDPPAMRSHARCLAPRMAHSYNTRSKYEARKYRQEKGT